MSLYQIIAAGILGVALALSAFLWSAPSAQTPVVSAPTSAAAGAPSPTPPAEEASTTPPAKSKTVEKSPAPTKLPSSEPKPETAPPPTPVSPAPATTTSAISLNDRVRSAVVNIVCTTAVSGPFNSISASGVVITSNGVVLTNSHVAQYFLLKDYPSPNFVNCIIRIGSPAGARYNARLLFMPPTWMSQNAQKINSEEPTGNGEHDYALLLITGTTNGSPMPSALPYLPISIDAPDGGQQAFLAAYPAGFLGGISVAESLYQSSAFATVGDLYTFGTDTLDLFSVGGTILSQHGSSGGAATDVNGSLIGLIVTATDAGTTASRDLRAISTPYIIRDFAKESGVSLASYLSGNLSAEADAFNIGTAPTLRQELVNALNGQ